MEEVIFSQEEDELDCKEIVLQKYFLQEWKIVKSLLDEIVSYGRVPDTSSVHKIRSIVLSHSLKFIIELFPFLEIYSYNSLLRF